MASMLLRQPSQDGWNEDSFRRVPWRGFVCVVLFCCACDFLLPAQLGLALAGTAYGFWSVWLGVREARSTVLLVNPLVTFQIYQAIALGLSPLYVAINYSAEDPVRFALQFVPPDQIAHGHAILVVGALALYLGMKHFQPKEAIPRSGVVRASSGSELLVCFVAGTAVFIFYQEVTDSVGGVFASLSSMPLAVLSLFAMAPPAGLRRSRWAYWTVVMIGTVILLFLNARGDSKMMLSFSFVPLALAALQRKRAGLLVVFAVGFVAFYLLVIAPLVGTMRIAAQPDEQGRKSVLDPDALGKVRAGLESDFSDDPAQYLSEWLDLTMVRLCDPVPAGVVSDYVATGGILLGAGMDYVPLAFIPRIFWHEKPATDRGKYFTVALGMASNESSATTWTGQTAAGELFWNFGWPGVIIGMYLLGAAFSGAWWGADRGNPLNGAFEMTAFIGVTLSFVLALGSDAGTPFVGAIAGGILLRVLIRVRDWVFLRGRETLGAPMQHSVERVFHPVRRALPQ